MKSTLVKIQIAAACIGMLLLFPAAETGADESTEAASENGGGGILEQVDSLVTYEQRDFSAEYTVIEQRPGEGTSRKHLVLFRRDSENVYTIVIQEPEQERGKGYVRKGDKLWLYDPVPRRFTVVNTADRFQNSNLRNSDFTRSSLAEDYRITGRETTELGAYQTDVYELEAVRDGVTFAKKKIWVDQNMLLRKMEDYSLSGRHMRTTAIPEYEKVQGRYVPVRIVIQDELRGRKVDGELEHRRTLIKVEKPSFQELPDMVFSKAYLERVSD